MKHHCTSIFFFIVLSFFIGCGEDSEEVISVIENGNIQGTITDKETGDFIKGASVDIGGVVVLTDKDGRYTLEGISFSDKIDLIVTAINYNEYKTNIALDRELLLLDINLVPVESPSVPILEVLSAVSREIGSLDPDKIPSIQSHFSEDYVAADDEATFFGIFAGVVPPNYDEIPNTIENIISKYDELEFEFINPDVELSGDSASVKMQFDIYAETKPKPPTPAKKWEIAADGRLDLQKQNDDWKITYWQLIIFLKFEEEPLEL